MRKSLQGILLGAAGVALAGCASQPQDIQANNFDAAQYDYMTCAQLADYGNQLNSTLKLATDQESDARTEDVIGYAIFQEPLGSQRHPAIPAEIADLKGKLVAVQSLQTSKNCGQQQASLTPTSAASAQ